MRINSVNSYSSPINFGYNKELNDKVNDKLKHAKGNKLAANVLLKSNEYCNNMEDIIRSTQKEKNPLLEGYAKDIFLQLKPVVTDILDERFPELNYRKTEMDGYKKEIKTKKIKDDFHWLKSISESLMSDEEFKQVFQEANKMPPEDAVVKIEFKKADEDDSKKIDPNSEEGKYIDQYKSKKKDKPHPGEKYVEKFVPNEYTPTGFSSLGGMDELKDILVDKVIYPLNHPEEAKLDEIEYGKKAPRGELLYGPPGCGKTAIIQALSAESGIPLYSLKIAKAGSEYVNKSATNVQSAYDYAAKVAKDTGKPVFLLMDEMESMTRRRKDGDNGVEDAKLVSTLLQIIEEARSKDVYILGATNCFDQLDDAIKSRFEDKIYIGLPDDKTRKEVLKVLLNKRTKGIPLAKNDEELDKVVKLTKGFSNRDLTILTDKAALIARKDNRRAMVASDFNTPVAENQSMKVKEEYYQSKQNRPSIGFSGSSTANATVKTNKSLNYIG